MKKLIELTTNTTFESSSERTPEYLSWHRKFKQEFTKYLSEQGATEIQIGKPNHFNASGFFRARNGQIWYFSISDLRGFKSNMMVRQAESFSDYNGRNNHFVDFTNYDNFHGHFLRLMRLN